MRFVITPEAVGETITLPDSLVPPPKLPVWMTKTGDTVTIDANKLYATENVQHILLKYDK